MKKKQTIEHPVEVIDSCRPDWLQHVIKRLYPAQPELTEREKLLKKVAQKLSKRNGTYK